MKVRYRFTDGEKSEIEVEEPWGDVLLELERTEHNNQQTQTRRHVSLDALNLNGSLLPANVDVQEECIRDEDNQALCDAIGRLLPQQQELMRKVFVEERTLTGIAREEGVTESAVRDRLQRIRKNIRENLK